MANDIEDARLTVPIEKVLQAKDELLGRNVHPFFPAYLALKRQSRIQGTTDDIDPNWADLGSYLYVQGSPPERPYLRPFWAGRHNAGQEWLNKNLAGSYAPGSLRSAPKNVVDVTPEGHFVLKPNHGQLAYRHLLKSAPLPALAVAAFMLRNRAIEGPLLENGAFQLINAFGREFGFRNNEISDFRLLFDTDWGVQDGTPWLEPLRREFLD